MEFELEQKEFIELNKILKLLGWAESGGRANLFISEGDVNVNGEAEFRKRKKLVKGDIVEFMDQKVTLK